MWRYETPLDEYKAIENFVAIYPWMMDAAYVDDMQVTSPANDWYGGWRTPDVIGPWNA